MKGVYREERRDREERRKKMGEGEREEDLYLAGRDTHQGCVSELAGRIVCA